MSDSKTVQDSLGRTVTFAFPPRRIVSLCPSQTETLFALGLNAEIVGLTRFCIHPNELTKSKVKVGGTKDVYYERIDALRPDLIISEKEENTPEIVETLSEKWPVYVTNVENTTDALSMIRQLGEITDRAKVANELVDSIESAFCELKPIENKRVAYLIWKKPYMAAARDTYIQSVLSLCGFENVFLNRAERYPVFTIEELQAAKPELILLSSEPYPFKNEHVAEMRALLPEFRLEIVDGEMFSWYGSRMLLAADYLKNWLLTLN